MTYFLDYSMFRRFVTHLKTLKHMNNLNRLHSPSCKQRCLICANTDSNWPRDYSEDECKFCHFSLFRYYLLWESSMASHLNRLETPLPKDVLYQVSDSDWPSGSSKEDFSILSMHFRYLVIISPRKRACPFF